MWIFSGNGAGASGAGLCGAGHQRFRRRAGAYKDAVAAAGALPDSGVPFINKMDLAPGREQEILRDLKELLGGNFVDFGADGTESFYEEAAVSGEAELEEFLETGQVSKDAIRSRIASRDLFPCYFGSALKIRAWKNLCAVWKNIRWNQCIRMNLGRKYLKLCATARANA